ncbi:MAG: ABC transporter substrate-binding protein [Gammaproteobacteria bacterium]
MARVSIVNVMLTRASTFLMGLSCLACLLWALFPPTLDPTALPARCRSDQLCRLGSLERVVIRPRLLSEWLTLGGKPESVLAVSDFSVLPLQMTPLGNIFPNTNHIRLLGRRVDDTALDDPESLLSMAPDAVLVWAWQTDAYADVGLPVVEIDNTERADEVMTQQWRRLASLTGARTRAEQLIAVDDANRKAVAKETAALPDGTYRPSMLIVRRDRAGGAFWPISWHFLAAKQIPILGGTDVTLAHKVRGAGLNAEELYVMDPDIIILPSWGVDAGLKDADPKNFYEEAAMQPLRAVKHRRVYRSPLFWPEMTGLAERALMMRWMAEIMYPQQTEPRLRALFRKSYEDTYGYALSDDEIDEVLRLRQNVGSAGVERFARDAAGKGG